MVLNINQKLESVAQELGIEAISCDSSMESNISAINRAEPVDKRILKSKAEIANQSVSDFLKLVTSNT